MQKYNNVSHDKVPIVEGFLTFKTYKKFPTKTVFFAKKYSVFTQQPWNVQLPLSIVLVFKKHAFASE